MLRPCSPTGKTSGSPKRCFFLDSLKAPTEPKPSVEFLEPLPGSERHITRQNTPRSRIRRRARRTKVPSDKILRSRLGRTSPQSPAPGRCHHSGHGSDNSNWSFDTCFEGVITAGRPSDDTDALGLKTSRQRSTGSECQSPLVAILVERRHVG